MARGLSDPASVVRALRAGQAASDFDVMPWVAPPVTQQDYGDYIRSRADMWQNAPPLGYRGVVIQPGQMLISPTGEGVLHEGVRWVPGT